MSRLGCASTYRAVINHQGGGKRYATLTGVSATDWERKLNDVSEAHVEIAKARAGRACYSRLGDLEPWAHELTLYRDGERLWDGPLWDVEEDRNSFTITARDPLAWLGRRTLHQNLDTGAGGWTATAAAAWLIQDALEVNDPGLLPFVVIDHTGASTVVRATQGRTATSYSELEEVAKSGLDFCAIGRSIRVAADKLNYSQPRRRLTERDFLADFRVRKVGAEATTRAYVVGDQFPEGLAAVGEWGQAEPGYGLIENVSSMQGTTDYATLSGIARRVVGYGNPVPIVVTLPAGSQLSPEAQISVHELVPGRFIDVSISSYAIPVRAVMKINQVAGKWTSGGSEQISISTIPKDTLDLAPAA